MLQRQKLQDFFFACFRHFQESLDQTKLLPSLANEQNVAQRQQKALSTLIPNQWLDLIKERVRIDARDIKFRLGHLKSTAIWKFS